MRNDPLVTSHRAFEEDRRRDALDRLERPFRRRAVFKQLGLFGVVLILWPIPNPIKLLVVVYHELSHVAAAYLTGGMVFGIAIDPMGAGVTLGIDGNPLVITMAGYVGSLLIGLLLYWLIAIWEPNEVWGVMCVLCGVSLAFGWLNEFTFIFVTVTLILMFWAQFYLPSEWKAFYLRMVATTCCLYPVIDVVGEAYRPQAEGILVNGQSAGSDVARLSELTGLPPVLLSLIWIAIGMTVLWWMVSWSARHEARNEAKRSLMPRHPAKDFIDAIYSSDPTNPPRYVIR